MASQFYILCKLFGVSIEGMFAARGGCENPGGAAIRDLRAEGRLPQRCWTKRYANNRIESDHRHIKRRLRAMQGPRTMSTAHRVIQGIEAVHMIRKAQLLGSQRTNLATTSIAIALLLKIA